MKNETTVDEKMAKHQQDIGTVSHLIYGNWPQQVTYAFAELAIGDCLLSGPKSSDDIAKELNLKSSYLMRMLRCAVELEFVSFDQPSQKFTLENRGEILSSNHPDTKRNEARLNGAGYRYDPWTNLVNIIKHGMKEEYSPTIKDGSLAYLADKPELLEVFHKTMGDKSAVENHNIVSDFDFSSFTTLMDIGAGHGSFLKAMLDRGDHLNGIMFDLPGTFHLNEEPGYEDRLMKMTGNFFDKIPDNADVYTMKNIIHNWREFKAVHILEKIREAMISTSGIGTDPAKKRLLIVENIVPDDCSPHIANWMDLNFMVIIDGAERTVEGYRELGKAAGLKLEGIHPTSTARHFIEYSIDF
jgi:hypothetical protein